MLWGCCVSSGCSCLTRFFLGGRGIHIYFKKQTRTSAPEKQNSAIVEEMLKQKNRYIHKNKKHEFLDSWGRSQQEAILDGL